MREGEGEEGGKEERGDEEGGREGLTVLQGIRWSEAPMNVHR